MKPLLQSLTDPTFMPHGFCYSWRPDVLWTHVLSDVAIGVAYYLIPAIMTILLIKRKQSLPHPEIFGLFIAFIFFCGTTHFFSIYVTWYPAYEYQGWLKALTAFISVLTFIVLLPKLPSLLNLPGIEAAYKKSQGELETLRKKNSQILSMLESTMDREGKIIELKKEVNQLLVKLNKPCAYKV